jgi:DNA (cytosine-5)-methyltransferase 1
LESPNRDVESTLSEFIKTRNAPPKYFLSPNAARGILRRADNMGRNLIPSFRKSLETLARGT